MKFRVVAFVFCIVLWAPALSAQSSQPPESEEQNETMRDTLKRMQIKREEQDHKKILDKGIQIKEHAAKLAKEAVGNTLPREMDKKLREIEKSAKQIRSDFGGNGENDNDPLEQPPANLRDAIKRLDETSVKLNEELGKTSRRVISVSVIEAATDVVQLVRNIRGYLF
jgi:hypothetical protein